MNQFLAIACNLLKEWGKEVLGLGFGVQGVIGFCFVLFHIGWKTNATFLNQSLGIAAAIA